MKLAIEEFSSGKVSFELAGWEVSAESRGTMRALRVSLDEGLQVDARAVSFERVCARSGSRSFEAKRVSLDATLRVVAGKLTIEASRLLFEGLRYDDPTFRVVAHRLELVEGVTFVDGVLTTPLVVARRIEVTRGEGDARQELNLEAATASDLVFGEALNIARLRLEGAKIVRPEQQVEFQRADLTALTRELPQTFGAKALQLDNLVWEQGPRTFKARRLAAHEPKVDLATSQVVFSTGSTHQLHLSDEALEVVLEMLELPQGGKFTFPRGGTAVEACFERLQLSWQVTKGSPLAAALSHLFAHEQAEASISEAGQEAVGLTAETLEALVERVGQEGMELALGDRSLGAASVSVQALDEASSRLLLKGGEPRSFELQLGAGTLVKLELAPLPSSP